MILTNEIFKKLYLNLNFIFRAPLLIMRTFILSCLPILLSIFLLPFNLFSPFIFENVIIFTVAILFYSINCEWEKSTLHKNSKLLKNSKGVHHVSLYLTILLISFLVINIFLGLIVLLSKCNFLMTTPLFGHYSEDVIFNFSYLPFGPFYFCNLWLVTIIFILSYIFSHFLKTNKSYYMSIFILVILAFLFGGTFNNYFAHVLYYHSKGIKHFYPKYNRGIFPNWFFYPSLLFPLYSPGQMLGANMNLIKELGGQPIYHFESIYWYPFNVAGKWDIILIMPIISTTGLLILSFLINSFNKIN